MLKFFSNDNLSESQARSLANTIERNTEVINKNYVEIRKIFFTLGYRFDLNRFIEVSSSMFAMLIIDNIKKRNYYNQEDALKAFSEEIKVVSR